jgi:hypothetical protein
MLYAAMTFWLLVIVLVAWGVHQLWSGMIKPRVVNSILLPGTLLAQLGRVMGTLITGGTVNNTTLMKDDDSGEPVTDSKIQPRIPIVGPILVAMLPLAACAAGVYLVSTKLGGSIVAQMSQQAVAQHLPQSLTAFWAMLRDTITLLERMVDATLHANLVNWKTLVFFYLVICLTVRMAPLPGNVRGALGAIILAGILVAVIGAATSGAAQVIRDNWTVLSLSVGVLLLLLIISLGIRGIIGLIRVLATQG